LLSIDLIRSELKQQESFWKDQLEKERLNWNATSSQDVEQAKAEFEVQKETFQKTMRALKVRDDHVLNCHVLNTVIIKKQYFLFISPI
jgi:hypothetical protein